MKEVHKLVYDSTTAISGGGIADLGSQHHASSLIIFIAAALAPVIRDLLISVGTWVVKKVNDRLAKN